MAHESRERKRPAIGKIGRGRPSEHCVEPPTPALLRGINEFNKRQFFECHETLEEAWIEETDPLRYLYQGILQVGVGFYHLRRGNFRGASGLLARGLELLRPFAPDCMYVDVARLISEVVQALDRLELLGPNRMAAFEPEYIPMVHLTKTPPERRNAATECDEPD